MRFVDSHLHLEAKDSAVLALARANGTLLLTCGVNRRTSSAGLRLAAAEPENVKAFVGVHPSEALRDRGLGWVRGALRGATGVGEVGLDPKYSSVGARSVQMMAFLSQLEAAAREGRPVQVHSRGAERECLEALAGFKLKSVLMHWLQAEEALPAVAERGYFVSFGPPLLYSKKLKRMAARCDPAQVLAETDSPVPYGLLGGVRGASLIPSVVFGLAEAWGKPFEEARTITTQNAMRYLGGEKG